ncbi:hypothetical protein BCT75_04300 [Vibrio lentus]|uniref:hypothetical protein n=1 Tax=Vibrio lentus TaxID=136468 RepID=UPI000C841052|nr:hypothetical protein [Vibrio lentus]PML45611.1 hypothetical protein BCT75_04300 [Vibrio lentus]
MNKKQYKSLMSQYRINYNIVLFAMNKDPDNYRIYSEQLKQINTCFNIDKIKCDGFDKYDPSYCKAWVIERAMNINKLSAVRASELAEKLNLSLNYPYPIDPPSHYKNRDFYQLIVNNLDQTA